MWKEDIVDLNVSRFFEMSARVVLSLLIVAILMAILAGIGCTFYDLRLVFNQDFHSAFKTIMVDILTVLAIVEVLRTALAYLAGSRSRISSTPLLLRY